MRKFVDRTLLTAAGLLFNVCMSEAQNVTVIGPVTPGDMPQFNSTTVIKDSGIPASSLTPCTNAGAFRIGIGGGLTQCSDVAASTALLNGGPLTINTTAATYNQGFAITQSGPTTSTAGQIIYDVINITHQSTATGGATQISGLNVNMTVGGANLGGGPVIGAYFTIAETISGVTNTIDKIGVVGSCLINIVDGGNGGCYGGNVVSTVNGGGATINRLVGIECDVVIKSGSGTVNYRYCFAAVNGTNGVLQGTVDGAFYIANIGGTNGAFKNGFVLSNSLGFIPLATTASLFFYEGSPVATIGNIFNFPNLTVTTNILKFPNVTLTGGGGLTLGNIIVDSAVAGAPTVNAGQAGVWASATAGLQLQGFGTAGNFDFVLYNSLSQGVASVAFQTRTLNINTLTLTNPLGVASGGTGLASGTSGGIPYFSGTTTIASSALLVANQIVLGGGAATAPATLGSLGTTTTVLHGNAAGAPSFTSVVSADLNITTTTCTNQFVTAISSGAAGTCTTATLASAQYANQGSTTTLLHGNAAGNPSWAAVSLTADVSGILPGANGGTGVNNGASLITIGGNVTFSGAFVSTITVTATTNSTLPAGTHTLAGLDVSQTFSGNNVFSGTVEFTGALFTFSANGQGSVGATTTNGALIGGQGSSNDLSFVNKSGTVVANITTGATNLTIQNALLVNTINNTANSANIIARTGTTTPVGNGATLLVVNDSGGIGIGTATDPGSGSLQINAQMFMVNITQTSAAQTGTLCWTTGTGKFTVDTTLGCLSSSARWKREIRLWNQAALPILVQLRPSLYDWREPVGVNQEGDQLGLIAEDVWAVDHRLGGVGEDGAPRAWRQDAMIAVLIKATQELKADNDNLRAEMAQLRKAIGR